MDENTKTDSLVSLPPVGSEGSTPEVSDTMVDPSLEYNNTANKITALRIAFVPLVVACLFDNGPRAGFLAALFFGIAAITDYFDGYYARSQKSVTVLGKLLDPLADKFLVVSSLIMLMYLSRIHPVIVIILICREMAITGLRAIASAEGIVIAASRLAKWKTVTQMAAIPMLMLHEDYVFVPFHFVGTILIWLSLLISIWSAKDYIVDFFKELHRASMAKRKNKREKRLAKRAAQLKKILEKDPSLKEALLEDSQKK